MDKLSDSEKKVLKMWIIFAIILMLIISIVHINVKNKYKNSDKIDTRITYVTDRNRHATVNNAIGKYYTYVNLEKNDSILNVLSKNYKEKNSINNTNINNYISDKGLTYSSRVMCFKNINSYKKIFYVEGIEEGLNKEVEINKAYYKVILDEKQISFSLEPITEEEYKGVCNEAH